MNKLKSIISYTLGALIVYSFVALAGTLTPGGNTSTATMYTLSDIYSKIQDISYTAPAHTVSTSSSVVGTMNTLTQVYDALDALTYTASDIATGTSIMGITGNITIPAEADVRADTTYGPNNTLTGEMSAGTPPVEWSSTFGPTSWTAAMSACQGLSTAGGAKPGVTWRLAYLDELISELSIGSLSSKVGGFQAQSYWSNAIVQDPMNNAYLVNMTGSACPGTPGPVCYSERGTGPFPSYYYRCTR